MSNPARLLADQFRRWAPVPSRSVLAVRGDSSGSSLQFWKDQRLAVQYLTEIEYSIDAFEASGVDMSAHKDALVSWWRAVFLPAVDWKVQQNEEFRIIDPRDLRALDQLASFLDLARFAPEVTEDVRTELVAAVGEVKSLVAEASYLDEEVRRYLYSLVSEAEDVLEEWRTFGEVAVRSISLELGGALDLVSRTDAVPDEKRRRWKDLRDKVYVGAGSSVIAQGLIKGAEKLTEILP